MICNSKKIRWLLTPGKGCFAVLFSVKERYISGHFAAAAALPAFSRASGAQQQRQIEYMA
jgi:hypothetical protein